MYVYVLSNLSCSWFSVSGHPSLRPKFMTETFKGYCLAITGINPTSNLMKHPVFVDHVLWKTMVSMFTSG